MKSLLSLATILISANCFACPTLTGHYSCIYEGGQKESVTVTQRQQGTVTIYTLNGQEVIADGIKKPYETADEKGTYSVSCIKDQVLIVADSVALDKSYTSHQEAKVYKTAKGLRQETNIKVITGGVADETHAGYDCILE